MILLTYRLDSKQNGGTKITFLRALNQSVLKQDQHWHYFLDPEGATLRFNPKFEKRVVKFLTKTAPAYGITFDKRSDYDPKEDEYYGVSFISDDILPIFHAISVLTTKYPPFIMTQTVLERLTHGLVNMSGVHDFNVESDLYLRLAEGRRKLIGSELPLPKWLYRFFNKLIFSRINTHNEPKES